MLQNQMNNNFYGAYPQPQGTAYGQFPTAKMTQPLTPEQIKQLRSTGSGFSLKVDEIEILKSQCTHKDHQGNFTTVQNPDGSVTCTICGETFNLVEKNIEEIKELVSAVVDVLQSTKTYYLDIPDNYVKDYFSMIPYLEKLPKFFEVATNNFAKYENGSFLNNNNNMYGFQMLNALTTPGFGGGMGYQQPQPQMGYGQPQMGYQNPAANPAAMGANPFGTVAPGVPMGQPQMGYQQQPQMGYGQPQPQMGYAPQPTEQQVAPQQQATQQQPAQQPQQQVVSTKTFNV